MILVKFSASHCMLNDLQKGLACILLMIKINKSAQMLNRFQRLLFIYRLYNPLIIRSIICGPIYHKVIESIRN